jgi:hypothetical protein
VNTMRRYIPGRGILFCAALLAFLLTGSALFAQTEPLAQRLPPNTIFCLQWHGKASVAGTDKKNHVLQLMEDPAFAPVFLALAIRVQQQTHKSGAASSAVTLPDLISFLDNPLAFGVALNPSPQQSSPEDSVASRFGFFAVYDATGKSDLIQKWKDLSRAGAKDPAVITKYDFGGASVEVRTAGKSITYSAQADNYYLASNLKPIIEDLVTRFRSATAPVSSLAQVPEYQQIRKFVGPDAAFEWFGRIPSLDLISLRGQHGETLKDLAKSVQLEKIHVAGGGLSFEGEATRVRGAVLGDTSTGGLFDLEASSTDVFQTQSIVNGSSTFTLGRINPVATYRLIHGALVGALPPKQSASIVALEGVAQSFLGMSIPDALGLLGGEVASVSSYSADGSMEQLYAVTIQKPDAVLRVLRAVVGSMIVAEDSSGTTTYLDIAYPYTDPQTGMHRKKFYYLAVTPQMILAAQRKAILRSTMQRLDSQQGAAPAGGIFANPEYLQLRSQFPAKLSGLSGTDITQIPWDKVLANMAAQLGRPANAKNGSQPLDLTGLKAEVISRHLHIVLSGLWKDSSGVYFDSYIQ